MCLLYFEIVQVYPGLRVKLKLITELTITLHKYVGNYKTVYLLEGQDTSDYVRTYMQFIASLSNLL